MTGMQNELDRLFGFSSTWTNQQNDGCWESAGTINVDDVEVDDILHDTEGNSSVRELILRFLLGHEKGHHLQEVVWPHRSYQLDHHVMEIEADLIGAWVLALRNQTIGTPATIDIVKRFDDANRIARQLGVALGDDDGNAPHHPWAEQRELALVRGPQIALLYPCPLTAETRGTFADDIRLVARQI